MLKLVRVLLPLALIGGVAVLPGCGGGSSGIVSNANKVAKYAGDYNGTFAGTDLTDNSPLSGTLTLIADTKGKVTGIVSQPGFDGFPLSGTVSSSGHLALTADPTADQHSTVTGTISNANTGAFTATFVTKIGSQKVVEGTITGARTIPVVD